MEVTKQGIEHKIPLMKKSLQLEETKTDKIEMPISMGKEDLIIKFNTKEELITILKTYLNQISSMKNNIEKIMDILSQSTEEIFQKMDVKKHKADVAINPDYIYEPYSEADEIKSEKIQKDKEEITLTALPPKPGDLKQKESEDKGFINPVPKPPTIISKQPKLQKITNIPTKTAEIKKDKEKTQADLKAELENVEGKLSSITNLINFIEKKHDGGKLDDKNYKRQIKKLQNDLDQSKKRIEEIKNELK
jgi:peptidoglycan hydrolase CwlO-like protein